MNNIKNIQLPLSSITYHIIKHIDFKNLTEQSSNTYNTYNKYYIKSSNINKSFVKFINYIDNDTGYSYTNINNDFVKFNNLSDINSKYNRTIISHLLVDNNTYNLYNNSKYHFYSRLYNKNISYNEDIILYKYPNNLYDLEYKLFIHNLYNDIYTYKYNSLININKKNIDSEYIKNLSIVYK
jgi:hypothetical protein